MTKYNQIKGKFWPIALLVVLLAGFLAPGPSLAAPAAIDSGIQIGDDPLLLGAPAINVEDRLFVPVLDFSRALGLRLVFDDDVAVTLTQNRAVLLLPVGAPQGTFKGEPLPLDPPLFIAHERIYVPVRLVAETFGWEVVWNADTRTVQILPPPPPPPSAEGPGTEPALADPAQNLEEEEWPQPTDFADVTAPAQAILEGLVREESYPVQPLLPFEPEEFAWLARVINAEAYNEPWEGMTAVGKVVVNRVLDDRFPDKIMDVLFRPGQFLVIANGQVMRDVRPEAYRAAWKALHDEEDPSQGALYFHNPRVSTSEFWLDHEVTVEIGNHRFTRGPRRD